VTQVIWALQAVEDVEAIRAHVTRDSAHATSLLNGSWPLWNDSKATRAPDAWYRSSATSRFREIIHGNYRIVYRLRHDIVEIATVFHGARLFRLE
jgi:toxin ParE1/3/4